ncbi:transcriptional regulator with XRE-family HTH domain [Caulobacter sp. BE264]|uniref:helix-turn-helix domain-containing protein n=1 Tax=Caulobacter sp. BE264 TaxID=2817724 RepID=UPI00285F932E|nr:transcriptional regulator with XRE-family HTH domain [Caulobacter sp. BE264]
MAGLRTQVGLAIRHQRKMKGWSQAQLAEKIGRTVETVNKIERGLSAPSFETLEALSRVLGVPVGTLFWADGLGSAGAETDSLQRLVARLSVLDSDDIDWADRLLSLALARKVRR